MLLQFKAICNSSFTASNPFRSTFRSFSGRVISTGQLHRKPSQTLPDVPVRTRFAPSPTGALHLGSLRTALFNFLLARATGGQFLLRIEDTDSKRTVPHAEEGICRDLRWAGLQWDEGPEIGGPHGPYKQSKRADLYYAHTQQLLRSGNAYRCFCSLERLHTLAYHRQQLGLPTDYDRTCSNITHEESEYRAAQGEAHVVRLKVPDVYPRYTDLTYGVVGSSKNTTVPHKHGEAAYEDPILLKSDGLPTYHLANVVDDHHMKITHVIRAIEWMPSTPKHLVLYAAFGWQPPIFAHVGLLLDEKRQKLSKRNMDVDIGSYKNQGIFPEALLNHVALLGWSHSKGKDFIPLEKMIEIFDLKFTKGNTVVNPAKLIFLQKQYAQSYIEESGAKFEEIVEEVMLLATKLCQDGIKQLGLVNKGDFRTYVAALLRIDSKQYISAKDFIERNWYFFNPLTLPTEPPVGDPGQHEEDESLIASASRHLDKLTTSQWTISTIKQALQSIVDEAHRQRYGDHDTDTGDSSRHVKDINKALYHWLRKTILGGRPGPGMPDSMVLLGRDHTLQRLDTAIHHTRDLRESRKGPVKCNAIGLRSLVLVS